MELHQKIEGVLFYKATPIKKTNLAKLFSVDEATLTASLEALSARLQSGATRLVQTATEVELVTAPELDVLIENLRKDEMKRDIGKAGAETLAIIVYRGPIARADIDRIRGVNSSFILRNLLVRGLIEKTSDDTKSPLYQGTTNLLSHLGIQTKFDLEGFEEVMNALDRYETTLNNAPTT